MLRFLTLSLELLGVIVVYLSTAISVVISVVLYIPMLLITEVLRLVLKRPFVAADYMNLVGAHYEKLDFYGSREDWLKSCSGVPAEAVELYALHWAHLEIANGGIDQFFYNSTGTIAPEAVKGFERIGMSEAAEVLASSMKKLDMTYPLDREVRRDIVTEMVERDRDLFSNESQYFYDYVCNDKMLNPPRYFKFANAYYDAQRAEG